MRSAVRARDLAERFPVLKGRRVLVLGAGRSGVAAARLLRAHGALPTVADRRVESDLGEAASAVRGAGAALLAGGHPPELAAEFDLLIVSPGVPSDVPVILEAARRGLPVWGEVELASRFCRGRIVGITGSNGKSTTTSMVGAILREAGLPGGTGGNLGRPFCEILGDDREDAVHAVELSSFQLELVETLRPAVAVLLNLSPDHLDRHRSYDDYAAAKARILETQDSRGHAVLNADDAESARFVSSVRCPLWFFSTRRELREGAFLRDGTLVLRVEGRDEGVLPASALDLPGEHNLSNALAAALASRLAGATASAAASALRSFRALPHRMQKVASVGGVDFYDDSKATNLDAAARALSSFAPGRVHVILGGKDKGADWRGLAPLLRRQAASMLLVGQASGTIRRALDGVAPLVECGTVPSAVGEGLRRAKPGDVVLLAPGCASFDQYRNFEERGDDFRRAVESLIPTGGADA